MKRLFSLLLLLSACPALAQIPGTDIQIDRTPVVGGIAARCLYVTSALKVGQQVCGAGTAANIQVGTTTVGGGTTTRILYDNAGVLGEYAITGTGSVVMSATPTLTGTPTVQGLTTTSPGWYAQVTGDAVPRVRVGLNATDVASIGFGGGAGARDAFIERTGVASLSVTSLLTIGAGAAATPSLNFAGDTTTGFYWNSSGIIDVSFLGSNRLRFRASHLQLGSGMQLGWSPALTTTTPDTILTRKAAATLQLGAADAASPVAQTLSVQSVVAGTTDTAGANWAFAGSQGTGTGAGGSIIFQTAAAGGTGSTPNALAAALTLAADKTATLAGPVILSNIGTDAATTSATLCKITGTNSVVTGTGTSGICLGTSSARFKHDVFDEVRGVEHVSGLRPVEYKYNDGNGRPLYGFIAEEVASVMPELVGFDAQGNPNTVDMLGMIPFLVNAIKELKAEVVELKNGGSK